MNRTVLGLLIILGMVVAALSVGGIIGALNGAPFSDAAAALIGVIAGGLLSTIAAIAVEKKEKP